MGKQKLKKRKKLSYCQTDGTTKKLLSVAPSTKHE